MIPLPVTLLAIQLLLGLFIWRLTGLWGFFAGTLIGVLTLVLGGVIR